MSSTPELPSAAEIIARKFLEEDINRFEKHVLNVFQRHGHDIKIMPGAPYLPGGAPDPRRVGYDKTHLRSIALQIAQDLESRFGRDKLDDKKLKQGWQLKLPGAEQELYFAVHIALTLPQLRTELQARPVSAEFAARMCQLAAFVPDPGAKARFFSSRLRDVGMKGGSASKRNEALQEFCNNLVRRIAKRGGAVTLESVWEELRKFSGHHAEPVNIPDIDEILEVTDNEFSWIDRTGKEISIVKSSLKPYVRRAKDTLATPPRGSKTRS